MVRRNNLAAALDDIASVGGDADKRLLWLGDFVKRDLSKARACDRAAKELTNFVMLAFIRSTMEFDIQQFARPNDVPAVQSAVRDLLRGLEPGHTVWWTEPPFEQPITVGNGLIWRKGSGVGLATRASGVSLVLAAVVDVLLTVGPRLARCVTPSCRRLFALRRKGQTHCVPTCGAQERMEAWREQNRERLSETRHRNYARKVRPARATRRPRKAK